MGHTEASLYPCWWDGLRTADVGRQESEGHNLVATGSWRVCPNSREKLVFANWQDSSNNILDLFIIFLLITYFHIHYHGNSHNPTMTGYYCPHLMGAHFKWLSQGHIKNQLQWLWRKSFRLPLYLFLLFFFLHGFRQVIAFKLFIFMSLSSLDWGLCLIYLPPKSPEKICQTNAQ